MMKSIWTVCALLLANTAFAEYRMAIQQMQNYQEIQFSGEIEPFDDRSQILRVLNQVKRGKTVVLKVGESLGGWMPTFDAFIQALKSRCATRKNYCVVFAVFTADCGSSCTDFTLLATYSVALPGAKFGFHRPWLVRPTWTIESKEETAERYIKMGGNPKWFREHAEYLSQDQLYGQYMTTEMETESGIIDAHLPSYSEFLRVFSLQ